MLPLTLPAGNELQNIVITAVMSTELSKAPTVSIGMQ